MADNRDSTQFDGLFAPWSEEDEDSRAGNTPGRAQGHASETLRLAAQNLLRAPHGQEFLYWLINLTGVFTPSYTGNNNTFYLEGRRAIGLEIYRLLMAADPTALQTIIDFQRHKETSKRRNS